MSPEKLITALFCLALTGCGARPATSLDEFSTVKLQPRYAEKFRILSSDSHDSSLIIITDPYQGADGYRQTVFVARNGELPPASFAGQVVEAPVQRAVCLSSSYIAMFDAIGKVENVVGVSGIDFISNDFIQANSDRIGDVGYDANLDFERLVALQPDVVLLYGITGENTVLSDKLRELGIPYIYIGDYVEQSPLGKAEWMFVIAEICNATLRANSVFDAECHRYNALKARAAQTVGRPSVMLNTPYRDMWFLPPADSYMVRIVEDAGGRCAFEPANSSASVPAGLEEAYKMVSASDVWLNVTASSLAELRARYPKIAELNVASGRPTVWNCNRRSTPAGGSDFWESGVVHPSAVLGDLVAILHPELLPDHKFVYYLRLE